MNQKKDIAVTFPLNAHIAYIKFMYFAYTYSSFLALNISQFPLMIMLKIHSKYL